MKEADMAYFPFFIELKNKKCCIIGGGMVAFRKIEALLEFEADITIISPELCEEILPYENQLHIMLKAYDEGDIEDAFLVIAATDDREVNDRVALDCRKRNILVNTVDDIDNCSFLFPAYVKMGDITIGVTTSGKSPVMAGIIKKNIKDVLPDFYEIIVRRLGEYRDYVKKRVPSAEARAGIFQKMASIGIKNKGQLSREEVEDLIRKQESKRRLQIPGEENS
jgi:siroheme synthase-like protein